MKPTDVHPVRAAVVGIARGDGGAMAVGFGLLFAGYLLAFATTLDQPILRSAAFAAINTAGAGLASLLFGPLLARFVVGRGRVSAVLHPVLAAAFAVVWYGCTLLGYAATPDWVHVGLRVAPFGPVALSWQMFQGVTVYAVLALFLYWRRARRELDRQRPRPVDNAPGPAPRAPAPGKSQSLLIRCEKEVVPIAAADIIRIAGADGYAEVITRDRRILSTTSLARFEQILPDEQFVRAHRSHIVRLAAVRHAEPAGNARLLLHLEDGTTIVTSRAGSRRLRELSV